MTYQSSHPHYRELEIGDYPSGKLLLVEPKIKHAKQSLNWIKDPEVIKFVDTDFANSSLKSEQNRLREILNNQNEYHWMIELNGNIIGNVSLHSIAQASKNNVVKTGIPAILIGDKNYWRKGIGSSVLKAVIHWAFTEADFKLITARVLQENLASQKNLEKLGFKPDGNEPYKGLINGKKTIWKKYKLINMTNKGSQKINC